MSDLVSVRAFAKLDGCSHTLVQKAVREGKLPVSGDGRLDPALAGTGWRKQNRRGNAGGNSEKVAAAVATIAEPPPKAATRRRSARRDDDEEPIDAFELPDEDFIAAVLSGRFATVAVAERVKENGLAAKNLLAARKEAGDVVDIEVAETILFDQARAARDSWTNWPTRIGPLMAAELGLPPEPVVEALKKHVHQQLLDLGEPDADFTDED